MERLLLEREIQMAIRAEQAEVNTEENKQDFDLRIREMNEETKRQANKYKYEEKQRQAEFENALTKATTEKGKPEIEEKHVNATEELTNAYKFTIMGEKLKIKRERKKRQTAIKRKNNTSRNGEPEKEERMLSTTMTRQ